MSENLRLTSRPISSGVLHVKGFGVIMAGESDMATYTGEGIGRIQLLRDRNWRGSIFYRTSSNGKLVLLKY